MITTTPSPIKQLTGRRSQQGGFTLVELMISAGLSAMILAGVLSSFLFLLRSGVIMSNYNDMEAQSRGGLEKFAQDVRQATTVTWNSSTAIMLKVNGVDYTYAYNSTTQAFTSNHNLNSADTTTRNLITGITPGTFTFKAIQITGGDLPLSTAAERTAANISTKQIQISLDASRTQSALATSSNKVLSARYILRNKLGSK